MLCCQIASVTAQINNDDVLFTVDEKPVLATDFLRVYNKNLDLVKDENQKDVDKYLKLYINYSLKLAEAKALEYDKKPQYQREFESYKKQLAKNYLTDHQVTDKLVREAYDRISYDVKASHILIRLPETETDTALVYKQMLAFRDRLLNEDFETVQKEVHNGSTVFAEDLGYFSGFKMVYDFENVAYNTPVGSVSQPFRTQFGYHVLKVFDKRPSRGEVSVGHIMISNNNKDSLVDPANRIQEIYKLIQQGENFESLARQFSDDQSSAKKGGKLSTFKSGQLTSVKFEDMAFSLKNEGDISEPFETDYGWHIAKLYEKIPIAPFEEIKGNLETRVQRDSRSRIINESFINSLKEKYKVTEDIDLSYFISIVNDDYFMNKWTVPESIDGDKPLVKIGKLQKTYADFASYLESVQKRIKEKQSIEGVVKSQFNSFLDQAILSYQEENLEFENEEYAHVLSEYRDGLLLFDLMETKIWDVVKNDSIGLQNYFDRNKDKYVWPERIDATIASSSNKNEILKVKQMLEENEDIESIKVKVNTAEKQNVIFTSAVMDKSHRALAEDMAFSLGVSEPYRHNDAYHVIHIKKILPSAPKKLEDAKGKIISDYQVEVENNWLQSLKDKYKIEINTAVLEKIKSQISN